MELPLGSLNSPFREKTYNCENFGRNIISLIIEQ